MGLHELTTAFQALDRPCKGYLTAMQLQLFHQEAFFVTLSIDQVEAAIKQVCGSNSEHVKLEAFEDVLAELDRRQNIEEQAYWDFQALDITGSNRISLRDAQLMFKDYHGDGFSLETWHNFQRSREHPNADIYFDEMRIWLCNVPDGEKATEEDFRSEEERSLNSQMDYWEEALSTSRSIQDGCISKENEELEHATSAYWGSQRKLNRWKKFGLKAMLLDENLDVGDMIPPTQLGDHVSSTDVIEAIDQKYKYLRELLLLEMSRVVAVTDDETPGLYQQLLYRTEQLRRNSELGTMSLTLPGAKMLAKFSLISLMGHIRIKGTIDSEAEQMQRLKSIHKSEKEIRVYIQGKMFEDVTNFGTILVQLEERHQIEKTAIKNFTDQYKTDNHLPFFCKLMRQLMLLKRENSFTSASVAVGLAERIQEYSADGDYTWERCRAEWLSHVHIQDRNLNADKPHIGKEPLDEVEIKIAEHMDLILEFISQITKKHTLEQETLISELEKCKDSRNPQEQMKHIRNQYMTWRSSSVSDASAWHKILPLAIVVLYHKWCQRLTSQGMNVTDSLVGHCLLADLHLRQEEEYNYAMQNLLIEFPEHKLYEMVSKSDSTLHMLRLENQALVYGHYTNIAYIVFGETEISSEEKEYVEALDKKYESLRDQIIIMALQDHHGRGWKRMSQEEKKSEVVKRKKDEKKMRAKAELVEMEHLVGPKNKHLPSLRVLVGEEKHEFETQLKKGQITDEIEVDISKSLNLLADLIPRHQNEHEYLLNWLRSRNTKDMSLRMKKLKIIHLYLEKLCLDVELDFEVAALRLGLVERILAVLKGRHNTDQHRQYQLAKKRAQLRRRRLMQGEEYVKSAVHKAVPVQGDIMGWQFTYIKEVIQHHLEEQEVLLNFLQDDSLEELLEPASMMTEGEKEQRLMELRDKRSKLNLKKQADREENLCILEEAAAVGVVRKQAVLQGSLKDQSVGLEEVTVAVLRDLQDEQDKELATILYGITNMDEDALEEKVKKERDARQLSSYDNILFCLTQCKEDEKDSELITVIDEKYSALQTQLIVDIVISYIGVDEWQKWSDTQKQYKLDALRIDIEDFLSKGNSQGLKQIVGDVIQSETINSLMGITRQPFQIWLRQKLEGATEDIVDPEHAMTPRNADPFSDLQHRHVQERDWLQYYLRGEHGGFPSWWNKQMMVVKIRRETWLSLQESTFMFVAMTSGLLEKQHFHRKPQLADDRERYLTLAKHKLEMSQKHKQTGSERDEKDAIVQEKNKTALLEAVLHQLERTHHKEREIFLSMFMTDSTDKHQAIPSTQQQRRFMLRQLQNERNRVRGQIKENHAVLQTGTNLKFEQRHSWISICREGEKISKTDIHSSLLADLLYQQNCMVDLFLGSLSDKSDSDLIEMQNEIIQERKMSYCDGIANVVFSMDKLDDNPDADVLEALKEKFESLHEKLYTEALINQMGEEKWYSLTEEKQNKNIQDLKSKVEQLCDEDRHDEAAKVLGLPADHFECLEGEQNILQHLENSYQKEKEELLRQMKESENKLEREKRRQKLLINLRRQQRQAQQEIGFNAAAMLLGLAEEEKKCMLQGDERKRQEQLAKQRLAASKLRRQNRLQSEDYETDEIVCGEDDTALREGILREVDKKHEAERDFFLQLLNEHAQGMHRKSAREGTAEYRDTKLSELRELHGLWKSSEKKAVEQESEIFQEAVGYRLEALFHQFQEESEKETNEEDLQASLLADLQMNQDVESENTMRQIQDKDEADLQQLRRLHTVARKQGLFTHIPTVLFGDGEKADDIVDDFTSAKSKKRQIVKALEEKYDAMRDKLLMEALMKQVGEVEWARMTEIQQQRKLLQLKIQERKLRQEGQLDKAAAMLLGDFQQQEDTLKKIWGETKSEQEQRLKERLERRKQLISEREAEGLESDEAAVEAILNEEEVEEKKKRKNVLEQLQCQFEEEKEGLLRALDAQKDSIRLERERQIQIAKLRRDQKRLKRTEKFETAAVILAMAKEEEEKFQRNLSADLERQREMARQKLESRRQRKLCRETPVMPSKELDVLDGLLLQAGGELDTDMLLEIVLETIEQRHEAEQDMLAELLQRAETSTTKPQAQKMQIEEVKHHLARLDLEHSKWLKHSQQMSQGVNEDFMTTEEMNDYRNKMTEQKSELKKILSEAACYKVEFERRNQSIKSPGILADQIMQEIGTTLFTELQQRQSAEGSVLLMMAKSSDTESLDKLRKTQTTFLHESRFPSLSGTIFQVTSDEDVPVADINKLHEELDSEFEQRKEKILEEGDTEEAKLTLKKLENEFAEKKKVLKTEMEDQRNKMREKLAARKQSQLEKDFEENLASQMLLVADKQDKTLKDNKEKESDRQKSIMQQRLVARKLARRKASKSNIHFEGISPEVSNVSRQNTADSMISGSLLPGGLHREKTVLDVELSKDQMEASVRQLMRQHTTLQSKIKEQKTKQKENLDRRLESKRGKLQKEVAELFSMEEKQKAKLQASKLAEKERQSSKTQELLTRARRGKQQIGPGLASSTVIEETEGAADDCGHKKKIKDKTI